ncbi:MAG: NAD(P)H-dependent oxidoreductase subunit E, partial [Clostridia bacterium]|nr:NAD(P)H-dependent oxidoreductase subunit E [Clostridia bacterium]
MITVEQLNEIRKNSIPKVALRKKVFETRVPELKGDISGLLKEGNEKTYRAHILCCAGTGCKSSGSDNLREEFEKVLAKYGLTDEVKIVKTGCFGLCAEGPIVVVYPEDAMYCKVGIEDVEEIVTEHIMKGKIVRRLLENYAAREKEGEITEEDLEGSTFFKKQMRIALHNCGRINPEDIEEYIAIDGYQALAKVVTSMTPDEVIQVMLDSGLRGRGGAGFPTDRKWMFAKASVSDQKYVCCNADEGDPGAFMDRSVLEGDPHEVLEAMAIAGYAIGANHGFIYVRAEYPTAVERLEIAIRQAEEYGIL